MASPEAWLSAAIETVSDCPAYPMAAPEGKAPPFVIYGRTATTREQQLDGTDDAPIGTFQVTIYVDGYLAAKTTADAIREAVNNFSGSANGSTILSVHLTDEVDGDPEFLDGRDMPTYVVEHTYSITWEE
ncbi:MAG: DUF3168 domain-containing protein [Candidatus Kapaibacterium sp.]